MREEELEKARPCVFKSISPVCCGVKVFVKLTPEPGME